MEDNSLTLKLISLLVIISLVAVLVAIYHFVTVSWCYDRRRNHIPQHHVHQQNHHLDNEYSLENSVVLLIPAHKHQKGSRVVGVKEGDDEDALCSICLCEFEENEELRTLPECLHSFHVSCIDMWLYSHLTCPVCRTDAVPSSQILFQFLDSDSDHVEVRHEVSNNV
ncbi:unnamed protein product [Lactuca virosa]|uniref:RING-type domain-containing protein n=1 Tax=Lactuca virosa TaxID=75947 RepID=A0AAU9MEA2_9ASTR|nr:unnamed protein product [Lactuca virosa]